MPPGCGPLVPRMKPQIHLTRRGSFRAHRLFMTACFSALGREGLLFAGLPEPRHIGVIPVHHGP